MEAPVFVSYRRKDMQLVLPLIRRLTSELVIGDLFFDSESIQPGEAWRATIDRAIGNAAVMLVAVGDAWLTTELERLEGHDDTTRQEIELGLDKCDLVIPVLLGSAPEVSPLPPLPSTIASLWRLQAAFVRANSYDADVAKLRAKFVDTVVKSRRTALAAVSLEQLASLSTEHEARMFATARLAARECPNDDVVLRSAGICELRRRNYGAARDYLARAFDHRDTPDTRYYLALAGLGGRRPYDLPEWEIYKVLDLLEPGGLPLGEERRYRALAALVKLDYFTSRGRNAPGLDDDLAVVRSSREDAAAAIREAVRLVPTSGEFVLDAITVREG